jgi:phosphate transport system substrate-binding protein
MCVSSLVPRTSLFRVLRSSLAALSLLVPLGVWASSPPVVDADIPEYEKVDGLSGTLSAAGSDTMLQLQTLMAEEFHAIYPQVTVEMEGKGSSTAPPALAESTVQIANMSRRIRGRETAAFEDRFGYEPVRVDIALDTVGIFVHRDNPIASLTIEELDAIFSKTRRCGRPSDANIWGHLGLKGAWATAPISLYGRNAASGTYGFFKDHALCRGDYKDTVKEQPGSASVVQGVENDRWGVGYSGIGYMTSGVRVVPVARSTDEDPVLASWENAANGKYPLTRFLEVYINKQPGKPLDRLVHEYLRFILSAEGQHIVVKAGFHPLDAEIIRLQLTKLTE